MVNDDSVGTSLVTQWLRCHTPSAGGSGLIPGQGFPVAQTVKRLPAMWETQVQSLGREGPLEKEMATCSSVLAWKTPWPEEPGGLQTMGSQRSWT